MFVDLETDRGEKITINSLSIRAYWTVKKNKVCVLLVKRYDAKFELQL